MSYNEDWSVSGHAQVTRRLSTFSTLSIKTALPLYKEDEEDRDEDSYYPPSQQLPAYTYPEQPTPSYPQPPSPTDSSRTCTAYSVASSSRMTLAPSRRVQNPAPPSAWASTSSLASPSAVDIRTPDDWDDVRSMHSGYSRATTSYSSSGTANSSAASYISRNTDDTVPMMYTPASSIFTRTPTTDHVFDLLPDKGSGPPWVSLRLASNAQRSSMTPHFYAGNKISGSMNFSVSEPTTIRQITVTLRGTIIHQRVQSNHVQNFLENTVAIWSRDSGDSRMPVSSSGTLIGLASLPFEMQFPTDMDLKDDEGVTRSVPLPESMLEENNPVMLQYKLIVTIHKGRFQSPAKISTDVVYTPRVTPGPHTQARETAYQSRRAIPGPMTDPTGWLITAALQCPGRLKGVEDVMVSGTVFLPNPTSYTRGTAVPCKMHLSSTSSRGIHLKELVSLRLCRRITYLDPKVGRKKRTKDSYEKVKVDISTVIWHSARPKGRSVTLDGELHIHDILPATSNFPIFTIEYYIILLAFQSSEFKPLDKTPLMKRRVEVATELPEGTAPPRPVTLLPHAKWLKTTYDSMSFATYF